MALKPPRSRAGFTLVEVLVATVLTGILVMAISAAYRATIYLQINALSRWPADAAADAAILVLAEQTRAATCLLKPAAAASGTFLLARTGADCTDAPLSPTPGFVAACLDAESRLVFWRGTGAPPATEACPPKGDFFVLSPGGVAASGLFRRDPIDDDVVRASFTFTAPASEGVPPYSVSRSVTIKASTGLRAP